VSVVERVHSLVAPLLADLGLVIYDLEHGGGVLRITVDRPGGVDLDTIALATRVVSRQLDHDDPLPGRYTLEVTSPGLERRLRTPAHFRAAVGADVAVRTLPTAPGERRVRGTLVAATDAGITVRSADARPDEERQIGYADIERARTLFEWGVAAKAAKPSSQRKAQAS
jgi:ribosome maturation factor RimP